MPGPVQRTVHNWGRRTKPVGEAILEKIKFIESTIGQDLRALLKDKYVSIPVSYTHLTLPTNREV